MDSSNSNIIDIFEIYRRYCDIRSINENENSRETLAELRKLVDLRAQASSLFNDLFKLLSHLDLTADSGRFACFYDFVFFMSRETGQKNITVGKAIEAWKLVLNGRFRLLNEWCAFVQEHQRHNISEDTWQQVLAFSRCVHEDLEGYDPKGAWPVLIDDFVDHMHRINESSSCSTRPRCYYRGDSEAQACRTDDSFPGLRLFSGLKRKPEVEWSYSDSSAEPLVNCKRNKPIEVANKPVDCEAKSQGNSTDDQMEIVKHGGLLGSPRNSACAVERSLSEGFAGLLSTGSCKQFDVMNNSFQSY